MLRNLLIAALSTVCLIGPARADPPDAYHAHYPPYYFFSSNAPPAPNAEGRFGFNSGEDRGFDGQYLREENYDRSHGLNVQAEYIDGCDTKDGSMAFMLCQREAARHGAWLAEHDRQREMDDACRVGICERTD